MSIFDVFKKKEKPAAPAMIPDPVIKISGAKYTFTLAKTFRGFKKMPMTVYWDKKLAKNSEHFRDKKVIGMDISFTETYWDDEPALEVVLDNVIIGYITVPEKIKDFQDNLIKAVYIKFEDYTVQHSPQNIENRFRGFLYTLYDEDPA